MDLIMDVCDDYKSEKVGNLVHALWFREWAESDSDDGQSS